MESPRPAYSGSLGRVVSPSPDGKAAPGAGSLSATFMRPDGETPRLSQPERKEGQFRGFGNKVTSKSALRGKTQVS